MDSIEVKKTKNRGRGVFALRAFKAGEVVEVCPVIAVIKNDQIPPKLEPYPYEWTKSKCAVVGGYASFYNHSYHPNVEWNIDKRAKTVSFICIVPISKGSEIMFDYNYESIFEFRVK